MMNFNIKKYFVYTIIIIASIIGAILAFKTFQYTIVVKGIMGSLTIFFMLLYSVMIKTDGSIEAIMSRSNQLYTFLRSIFFSLVFVWSLMSIHDLLVTLFFYIFR